jgi:hypothetical protein
MGRVAVDIAEHLNTDVNPALEDRHEGILREVDAAHSFMHPFPRFEARAALS